MRKKLIGFIIRVDNPALGKLLFYFKHSHPAVDAEFFAFNGNGGGNPALGAGDYGLASQRRVKRLLDAGFYNFLIPFVQSAEEAKRAVAATRYPPEGVRGVSVAQRSNRYGTVKDYLKIINDNITVMVQIENRTGIAALDEICAVPGVDGIFIGPSDLAAAYGHLGNASHPEVQEAMQIVFARAKTHGKSVGILAPAEADARRYLEMGASFVAVGSDLGVFRAATQALRDKYL